jgi:hypothetical protein
MNTENSQDSLNESPDFSNTEKSSDGHNNIFVSLFAIIGQESVKILSAVLLGIIRSLKFILSEIFGFVVAILKLLLFIIKVLIAPFRKRMKVTADMQKMLRRAKKSGTRAYIAALIKCFGSYTFGEDGIVYTAFNYILPIVSVAFLVAVIRYGSGLEYGICVEYNGKEIGIISAESDFDNAAREVQQRISYLEGDEQIDLSANFSLRIISDNDKYVSSLRLADEMLAVSDRELTDAYGIYIDGEFIGAVKDKEPIEDTLDDILLNYSAEGIIHDVAFQNTISYSEGIYLAESVMSEDDAISLLTSQKKNNVPYVVQQGDSPIVICQKNGMELEEFQQLNPNVGDTCDEGTIVTVVETESYLPIQYVREMETLSFIDYESIEVETSSLNVGSTATLVKGEKGERRSKVEVTYIDGIERSRKIVSSEVTKEPVMEQIGIGTYSARPASSATMLYGTGEFGWPVDGGFIYDPFLSDRNHKGIDIDADAGTDIYAAADGVVVSAGWNPGGYGFFVMIDHLNGYQTLYGHCSLLYVESGQTVTRGQLIAAVGSTGDSTGNHCHFEVRYMGMCYDPTLYINTASSFEEYTDDDDDDN